MKARVKTYLNIRTGKPEVLPDNNPDDAFYKPGDEIEITGTVTGEEYKKNKIWYKLTNGTYVWSGGVYDGNLDYWFDQLRIKNIWDKYSEKGNLSKVLILDSGINNNITGFNGVIENKINNYAINSKDTLSNDINSHGTHCAGLIASLSNNFNVGIAPQSKLLICKVTEKGQLKDGTELKLALIEYLKPEYAFDIISISQTIVQKDTDLLKLIQEHISNKKIIIAAIGNDSSNQNSNWKRYPGYFDECISVGACERDNSLSKYTCCPDKATIYAYGSDIGSYKKNEYPEPLTGTSQATAIVAGICSLIISFLKKKGVAFDQVFISDLLKKYSVPLVNEQKYRLIDPTTIFNNFKS